MAAAVAMFRLVPAQSEFDVTHSTIPGDAAQRHAVCWLPAKAEGDEQVRLEIEITDHM